MSYVYNGNFKSLMFKFVLEPATLPKSIPSMDIQLYRAIYVDKVQQIRSLEIPENSYIMPSGIYGQR